ncbi:hypothetical protein [Vibrio rumoiensis]|uniref:GspE/PulE/PilB domain-containing protein n=1 Tax=Vibrio rumoiensis TaxID=76258 RepID=UPI0024105B56|nr:hypothetical protein [Vibrio rumoiensis]
MLCLSVYAYFDNSYQFISIISDDKVTRILLIINTVLLCNRLFQRFYFVSQYYGYWEGVLSLFRLVWGTIINFSANIRAIKQVIEQGDPRRVAWDKTTHDFPSISTESRTIPIGKILIDEGYLSKEELEKALINCPSNQLLGCYLVGNKLVSNDALSRAIAIQGESGYEACDPYSLDPSLFEWFPKKIALKYTVIPLRMEGHTLILGKESVLSPVGLAAIKRRLGMPVQCIITTNGTVTVGIRYWYLNLDLENPMDLLECAIVTGKIKEEQKQWILDIYYSSQSQLGRSLLSERLIEPSVLNQAILAFESELDTSLGRFLVERKYITEEQCTRALNLQVEQQKSIYNLIEDFSKEYYENLI